MKEYNLIANSTDRLDKIIVKQIDELTRSRIQQLIKEGNVKVDGKVTTQPANKIKENSIIVINIPEPKPSLMQPFKFALDIIFEDDDLIVINKPAGLTVHPGAGNHQDTLANALIEHTEGKLSSINGVERPGIVHRLDKDTSGLMVVAKNDQAHQKLSIQLAAREIKRIYHALIWGVPKQKEGLIENYIARSKSDRTKMAVYQQHGKKAITNYQILRIFNQGAVSLVECKLATGRTHQIRVHMSHLGHSILGDQTYGKNNKKHNFVNLPDEAKELKRQALHAKKLAFTHPSTNEYMSFESELPNDLQLVLQGLI